MKNLKFNFFICMLVIMACPLLLTAQEIMSKVPKKDKNNVIYLSASGDPIFLFTSAKINYERKFPELFQNGDKNSLYLQMGFGRFAHFYSSRGYLSTVSANYCINLRKSSNIELGLGIKGYYFTIDYRGIQGLSTLDTVETQYNTFRPIPLLYTGYRYQNPESGLVLKIGLGLPELLNLGVGVAF